MSATGSVSTRLVIIRGNSGSGKSALAAAVRAARPRGVAIIGQDQVRRELLHARDLPDGPAVGLIDLTARYTLDHGLDTVVEGILREEVYGPMLRALITAHQGVSGCYRYELPFAETLRRHATKPVADEFGERELARWWRDSDPLTGVDETVFGPQISLADGVARVLADCGWETAGHAG